MSAAKHLRHLNGLLLRGEIPSSQLATTLERLTKTPLSAREKPAVQIEAQRAMSLLRAAQDGLKQARDTVKALANPQTRAGHYGPKGKRLSMEASRPSLSRKA